MNASLSSLFRPRALVIDSARAPLDSALAIDAPGAVEPHG